MEGRRYIFSGDYLTCPSCGRKGKYRDFVDTYTGAPVAHLICGRCFSASCGYDLTPSAYYEQHPDERHTPPRGWTPPPPPPPPSYIDTHHVTDYITDQIKRSNLLAYLLPILGHDTLLRIVAKYYIGIDADGATRWAYIDDCFRVNEIKVQQHHRHNGHRTYTYTFHQHLRDIGEIDPNTAPARCLFGQHLLAEAEDTTTVAIVESEKTAIMCAAIVPDVVWLATGGCSNFSLIEKAQHLLAKCNAVILYPDAGVFDDWRTKAESLNVKNVAVSDFVENHPSNSDIGDLLIYQFLSGKQILPPSPPSPPSPPFFGKGSCFPEKFITPISQLTDEELHSIFLI